MNPVSISHVRCPYPSPAPWGQFHKTTLHHQLPTQSARTKATHEAKEAESASSQRRGKQPPATHPRRCGSRAVPGEQTGRTAGAEGTGAQSKPWRLSECVSGKSTQIHRNYTQDEDCWSGRNRKRRFLKVGNLGKASRDMRSSHYGPRDWLVALRPAENGRRPAIDS